MYVTVTSAALLTPDNRHSICPDDKVWERKKSNHMILPRVLERNNDFLDQFTIL